MICFDTMVVIWAVQKKARSSQQEKLEITQRYLAHLRDQAETIMLPTPVLAEYLQGFESDELEGQLEKMTSFFLAPFDVPSACLAAELARKADMRQLYKEGNRQAIKTDVQIIATAIVHQADKIVTNEVEVFRQIAGERIEIGDVPKDSGAS